LHPYGGPHSTEAPEGGDKFLPFGSCMKMVAVTLQGGRPPVPTTIGGTSLVDIAGMVISVWFCQMVLLDWGSLDMTVTFTTSGLGDTLSILKDKLIGPVCPYDSLVPLIKTEYVDSRNPIVSFDIATPAALVAKK
jgi:hypothetical protein